jgi:4-azaleucine resistance transporter AzlC
VSAQRGEILRAGAAAGWPICLGYFPVGLALGVLARQNGLSPLDIGLMSLLVFAGSAQFIAVAMIGAKAAPLSIVATTFIVNSRHLLMSSALAVHLRGAGKPFLALFAYGVTDESFAVNLSRFRDGWDRRCALVVNHLANGVWIAASILGALVGALVPPGACGINFALPAMFIALLVFQLRSRIHVLTAIIAAMVSVLWSLFLPGDSYAVAAAVIAATVGYLLRRRRGGGQ